MPVSAVQRGEAAKRRTLLFLRKQGYWAESLQRMFAVQTPRGFRYVKRDLFGADVLAINALELLLIQVKSGPSWRSGLAEARREFLKYPIPAGVSQVIHGWLPRAHEPIVEVVRNGPGAGAGVGSAVKPVRQRRTRIKALPLFERKAG